MADRLDQMMYSFVVEDVLKGLFIYVPPGYVACVYDLGRGVLKKVMMPGLHLKIPFWQKAKLFNTQTLEYSISDEFRPEHVKALGDVPLVAQSSDGKRIQVEGTILLRLDIEQIPMIWQNIGDDFARYPHADIYSTRRDQVEIETKQELERIFFPRGIRVENVLLSDIRECPADAE